MTLQGPWTRQSGWLLGQCSHSGAWTIGKNQKYGTRQAGCSQRGPQVNVQGGKVQKDYI
jgi:hypothetical protein